ncbi:hypothetical protein DRP05_14005 [Archaeoglobales archaeon]|nr:MAG: hypothetical protein DRP05_14005 [Archaeoglobales archaeon]
MTFNMEWKEFGNEVVKLLKLRTPPIGVHFSENDEIPDKAFVPSKYGLQMAVCQAIGFSRFTGRTIALRYEDFACPPAMVIYGLVDGDVEEILVKAEWIKHGSYDAKKLPKGKYKTFVFGDLTNMDLKPQAILIFGNPAQIGRLIQATTYHGGSVKAELTAKTASCGEALIPAINGEVTIAVPGAGDRVFAGLDEDEMIFSMPYEWMERIIEGLRNAGRGANVSYPVIPFLFFTPRFPKMYREVQKEFKRV